MVGNVISGFEYGIMYDRWYLDLQPPHVIHNNTFSNNNKDISEMIVVNGQLKNDDNTSGWLPSLGFRSSVILVLVILLIAGICTLSIYRKKAREEKIRKEIERHEKNNEEYNNR